MLLAHVMLTRLYIIEYKYNNMHDVNIDFENSTSDVLMSWSGRVASQKMDLCQLDNLTVQIHRYCLKSYLRICHTIML